jgi:hypothetical protein
VQALKDLENLARTLLLKADSIVFNRDNYILPRCQMFKTLSVLQCLGRKSINIDMNRMILLNKFQRVTHQVHEQLPDFKMNALYHRHRF